MSYQICIAMLFCRDLEKSKAFYTETLGLEIDPRMSSDTFLLVNMGGNAPISLQPIGELPAGVGATPGAVILGLRVEDVDTTYADLKGKDVEMLTDVRDVGVGRSFQAKDPDGHVFEITQFYPGFDRAAE